MALPGLSWATDSWYLVSDQTLRGEPAKIAPAEGRLAAMTRVEVLEKRGGFARVKADQIQGWVSLFALRQGDRQSAGVLREVSDMLKHSMRETEATRIVAVTGLRGVMEEAQVQGKPDTFAMIYLDAIAEAAAKLPPYQVDPVLKSLPHLPEPTMDWNGNE